MFRRGVPFAFGLSLLTLASRRSTRSLFGCWVRDFAPRSFQSSAMGSFTLAIAFAFAVRRCPQAGCSHFGANRCIFDIWGLASDEPRLQPKFTRFEYRTRRGKRAQTGGVAPLPLPPPPPPPKSEACGGAATRCSRDMQSWSREEWQGYGDFGGDYPWKYWCDASPAEAAPRVRMFIIGILQRRRPRARL